MIPILINSEFLIIMHSFPLGLDEIPQGLAIYGQLINLTSICKHRKKKPEKMTNDIHLRKEGKGGNIQWLAIDSIAHSVGGG